MGVLTFVPCEPSVTTTARPACRAGGLVGVDKGMIGLGYTLNPLFCFPSYATCRPEGGPRWRARQSSPPPLLPLIALASHLLSLSPSSPVQVRISFPAQRCQRGFR